MKTHLLPVIKLTIICMVFFMGIYTLVMLGIAQVAPNHGKGFVIEARGKKYYENIAQKFTDDKYFWSRPSAVDYNAAGSGGSNKGPSNPDYLKTVQDRIDTFMVHNPTVKKEEIPSDIVTASGSGEDPDISVQAAIIQIARISKIRRVTEIQLKNLIDKHTEKPLFGLFGTKRINVLELNIDLDNLK